MSKPWSPQAKRLIAAGAIIFGGLVLYRVRSVVAPLALAILLAYILNPLVGLLRKLKLSRTGATIIVYLLLIFALVATLSILIPPLVQELISIDVDFAAILTGLRQLIVRYQTVEFLGFSIDLYRVFLDIQGELATLVGSLASQSVTILRGAAYSALWGIFVLIISFYLLLIFVLVATPSILIPPLLQELISIDVDFAAILAGFRQLIVRYQTVEFLGFSIDLYRVFLDIQGELATLVGSLASQSVTILRGAAYSALWGIFVLIISFYLLKDANQIVSYLEGLAPLEYREEWNQLMEEISDIWDSFLRGQIILSSAVGGITAVTMWIVGVKNALLLGIVAGILEIIPNLGPTLAALPAVALALFLGSEHLALSNGWFALLVAGLYVAIQQVENNFLVPRIIGRSVNIHPVVVIVGAIGGAMVGGILGIFLAAPVLASARILGGYIYRKLLQTDEALAQPTLSLEEISPEKKTETEKVSE